MAHYTAGKSSTSSVISHRQSRPTAAMAGSFSRKIFGPEFDKGAAGQADQLPIRGGKLPYKKPSGTTRSIPAYVSAPSSLNTKGRGGKQRVKGGHGKAGSDAKQASGQRG